MDDVVKVAQFSGYVSRLLSGDVSMVWDEHKNKPVHFVMPEIGDTLRVFTVGSNFIAVVLGFKDGLIFYEDKRGNVYSAPMQSPIFILDGQPEDYRGDDETLWNPIKADGSFDK